MSYLERALRAGEAYRARTSRSAPGDADEHHRDAPMSGPSARPEAWRVADAEVVEIRVPFLVDTLFFVTSDIHVYPLLKEGISRGRIWTTGELNDLFSIPDLGPSGRLTVTIARALFDGEVVSVTRRAESAVSEESPPENCGPCSPCEESEESDERVSGA